MAALLTTLAIAFAFVLLALFLLGIGWVLTGKVRIERGACGMDPEQLRNRRCGSKEVHCALCKPERGDDAEDLQEKSAGDDSLSL